MQLNLSRLRLPKSEGKTGKISLRIIGIGALVLALVLVIGFAVPVYMMKSSSAVVRRAAMIIPYPAAFVGATPITMNEFFFTRQYSHHFYEANQQTYDSKVLDKQILDELVNEKIVAKQAAQAKVTITNDEVEQAYKQLVADSGQEEFNKVLRDLYDLNEQQFKDLIRPKVLSQKLQKTLTDRNEWYQIKVRHILVKVDSKADQKQVDEAKAKAQAYADQIKAGKSFDEVARANSEDTASKDQGGDLGFISRGQTVADFEKAVFGAKKGDLVGPVRTEYGWHIILIEDQRGSKDFQIWRDAQSVHQVVSI